MIDSIFERLSDEAMSLRITEKFFSEIERSLLREADPAFDVSRVKENLKILNPRSDSPEDARGSAIDVLRTEFSHWRETLQKTDATIETFHIRRFCDSARISLSDTVFFALARFYRSIPLSRESQSKFDLMMTRAFAREMRGRNRHSQFDREKVADKLRELYSDWHEGSTGLEAAEDDVQDAEIRFNAFIAEAYSLSEFEGLIESDIFERFREFKRELGELYFAPECVAAAVECNITVGRTFDSLMTVLNSRLNQQLGEKIDFAGALIDGSLEGNSSLVDLLSGMSGTDANALPVDGNSDIALLRSFLQRATLANAEAAIADPNTNADPEESVSEECEVEPPNSIKHRLSVELATISQPQPDTYVLRNYMSRSETLDHINLNDFLFEHTGEPSVLGRRALASILCLEEFKDTDLKNSKVLEPEITNEIVAILNFAERVGNELAAAVNDAGKDSQTRLLIVSNSLLSSRLQVERAVVRFTSPIVELEPEPVKEEKPAEPMEITRAPLRDANRWLMAVTAVVFLVCGSILLFSGESSSAAMVPEGIEEVNISRLPAPEHLVYAFRKENTLYVTTKASWAGLKDDYKRKILQKMVEIELRKPLFNVSLIGPDGQPMADISSEGPVINEETPSQPEATK